MSLARVKAIAVTASAIIYPAVSFRPAVFRMKQKELSIVLLSILRGW